MGNSGLVTAKWLLENYQRKDVKILDASMDATVVFPDAWKSGPKEFAEAHIPGARFFDIDGVSDPTSGLPHTLPSPEIFQEAMRSLGISNDDQVIIYDNSMLRSAARGWWMFRVMGHDNVRVLDGGLEAWRAIGGPFEGGTNAVAPGNFTATLNTALLRTKADMQANLESKDAQVVDARGGPRFKGEVQEPRPGLASGHIPGAKNVPFSSLYEADGRLKSTDTIKAAFDAVGLNPDAPIIASCGSGVTACNLTLALYETGSQDVAVYDGSWVEWGSSRDVPIETGPA